MRQDDSERVAGFLQGREAKCPLCGYDLRDNATDVCPECGKRLTLSLAIVDLSTHAWVILTILFSVSSGPGVLIIITLIRTGRIFATATVAEILAVAFFLGSMPVALLLLLLRSRFLRLGARTQWTVSVIGALAWLTSMTGALVTLMP